MPPLLPLALAAAWTIGLGVAGAVATTLGPWYRALRKPAWQPPDWLFGPAWTTIFLCAAAAFVVAWQAPGAAGRGRTFLVAAWTVNGLLNLLWSVLFFRMRRPDWALLEIAPLWLSILAMLAVTLMLAPRAGWLLAPYLAWVAFAAVLNGAIVRRNGPFGA